MTTIRILHVSDLHYSQSHLRDMVKVRDAFIRDIESLTKESPIDLIVFSGDLVDKGDIATDFDAASEFFLKPLIHATRLDFERLFICPGNHDVQKAEVDEIIEDGFQQVLKDREAVNRILDEGISKEHYFSRLSNYNQFREHFGNKNPVFQDILCSSFIVPIRDTTVGVCTLNTAWRATGKPDSHDYGKLVIGERQLDNCLAPLAHCDLNLAVMHHPFEWLMAFERSGLKRAMFSKFQLILCGHNHYPEPLFNSNPLNNVIVNQSGCLYQSRQYFNGYSILTINAKSCEVQMQTYFDNRQEFDKAVDWQPEGKSVFSFAVNISADLVATSHETLDRISKSVITDSNEEILSSSPDSDAPKEFREVFVEPLLAPESEFQIHARAGVDLNAKRIEYCSLNELMSGPGNYLIRGRKETGKTTLLKAIAIFGIENLNIVSDKLPFYIHFPSIGAGNKPIHKQMRKHVGSLLSEDELEGYLTSSKCLILIDDVDPRMPKRMSRLLEFTKSYQTNRFIFTLNDGGELDANPASPPLDIGVTFSNLYIHQFNRSRTKHLVQKWFRARVDSDDLLEKTYQHANRMNLPRSPVVLSLILWAIERQPGFVPANKASLVEKLVEIILEKLRLAEDAASDMDYRNREHYLSHIAYKMVQNNTYEIERLALEKETFDYFDRKGLKTSIAKFIEYFLTKGILVEYAGNVSFKFKCFCEYFIARKMMEDLDFRAYITFGDRYLSFVGELDYFTGLLRNTKELVADISTRVEKSFTELALPIDLKDFEAIGLDKSFLEVEADKLVTALEKTELPDEERHRLLDSAEDPLQGHNQLITRAIYTDKRAIYSANVFLLATTLRNCELIDDVAFKRKILVQCIKNWARLEFLLFANMKDILDKLNLEMEEGSQFKEGRDYLEKVLVPLIVQLMLADYLGSSKLESTIKSILVETQSDSITDLLASLLYFDVVGIKGIEVIKALVQRCIGKKYLLEIISSKLVMHLIMKKLPYPDRQQIQAVIADIYLEINRTGRFEVDNLNRNKIMERLKTLYLSKGAQAD